MNKHTKEFDTKTSEELQKLLGEKREALREFRFGSKGSRTRDTKSGATIRKDIARLMTIAHQKRAEATTN